MANEKKQKEKKLKQKYKIPLESIGQQESFPLFYLDSYAQNVQFDNSFGQKFPREKSFM